MACKLCARLRAHLWEKTDAWERAYASESAPWSDDPVETLERIEQAYAVQNTDRAAAFRLFLEAAEAGSAWALGVVAWRYWTGTDVAADFDKAQEYYRRAMGAGSWMAAIHYARLLAELGQYEDCESVLEDGVSKDFVPAYFWLAWSRHQRCKSRKVCREIKSMLEHAAEAGHPAAQVVLGQWMARGRFGLRAIPTGLKWISRWASRPEAEVDIFGDRRAAGDVRRLA